MTEVTTMLSRSFQDFLRPGRAGALALVAATAAAMILANSPAGPTFLAFWQFEVAGLSLVEWVNDALMAVFFLHVGLELERELYNGELADRRKAMLPLFAAIGGLVLPAAIHLSLAGDTPARAGAGVPMATDIAFALGILALLGDRVPAALKVFLSALAVADDLAAMLMIALVYSGGVSLPWLAAAGAACAILLALNRLLRVQALWPYLVGGAALWFFLLRAGIHPTLAGVALAFTIPFSALVDDAQSPSHRLEHALHMPVAFFVLPVFALANTGIVLGPGWQSGLLEANSLGIFAGLVLGKPIGILLACAIAIGVGLCRLPQDIRWAHLAGAGMLGGVGFTMSIFIANLAFAGDAAMIDKSKAAVLLASLVSSLAGLAWLYAATRSRQRL